MLTVQILNLYLITEAEEITERDKSVIEEVIKLIESRPVFG